jgi:protein-disulfide isomerase
MDERKHWENRQERTEMKIDNDPDNNVSITKEKIKGNPWIAVSIVLGIVAIILLFMVLRGGVTGNVIKGEDAGTAIIEYLNGRTGGGVEYISNEDIGSLYKVIVSYQGQEIPVYTTKDGKYFVQGAIPMTGEVVANSATDAETPTEVTKSDKPVVEAFIFSYCPYGLQFEKALFPVYDLLKNSADINIVAIGAMHGEYEKTETLRQISIEQLYGKDKLFAYLKEFNANTNIGSCSGDDACLDKYLPTIYTKLGIDKTKVENYMKADALTIYDEQGAEASSLGIGGSPTFVINGIEVQVSRTPEAIKQAVCDAFNTAPSECSQTLSTDSASAGFGASAGGSAGSPAVQCAS